MLQETRERDAWQNWLEFFLDGVVNTSEAALESVKKINNLFDNDINKLQKLGRARFSCVDTLEYLKELPRVTVPKIAKDLKISQPTARTSLNHMVSLGIIKEVSHKQRDKIYVYQTYLDILSKGAEPLRK